MNKQELIAAYAEKQGVTKKAAAQAVEGIFGLVKEELTQGGLVKIPGFGTFSVVERAERNGVNPKTTEAIVIPARKAPKFKASTVLKAAVK